MTAATETKKPVTVLQETNDLAERITKSLSLDAQSHTVTPTSSIYEEAATEAGITQEEIGKVKSFEIGFVAATTKAIGTIGINAMEKEAEINRVTGEIPMFKGDSFRVSVDRSSIGRNPRTGEPTTTYGSIKTEFVQSTGSNRGQMSKVRLELRELAETALNKGK